MARARSGGKSSGGTAAPRGRGFRSAARLVEDRVRAAGAKRGFAAHRLLTHWDEIVGPDTARMARPVKLGWSRGKRNEGLGATLTLAVTGAAAPMVQMMAPRIVERVNAALGFAAVARITLAQGDGTAPPAAGMAEAPTPYVAADPSLPDRAAAAVDGVGDPALRAALEALARSVLSRTDRPKGSP